MGSADRIDWVESTVSRLLFTRSSTKHALQASRQQSTLPVMRFAHHCTSWFISMIGISTASTIVGTTPPITRIMVGSSRGGQRHRATLDLA